MIRNSDSRIQKMTESPSTHFGNLISNKNGLLTQTHDLSTYSPIQRIFISANGNLQQMLSAYHNSAISVTVVRNILVDDESEAYYDRCVTLNCKDIVLCVASSKVYCISDEAKEAVASGNVGIGQLFKHFNILPEFELLACGMDCKQLETNDSYDDLEFVFWRKYVLSSRHLRCEIEERFTRYATVI